MIAAASTSSAVCESVPLPPSGRDFEVYRRLAVEGRTTREVAAEFEISQTRVMQLRAKVLEWIGTHLPLLARLTPADRLRVAETLACEQLQHQYDEAMEAWRKSATAQHVTRYVGRAIEDGMTVVKESYGDPRYLRLATQISKAIAKLGMATVPDPETAVPVTGLAELLMSGTAGAAGAEEHAVQSRHGGSQDEQSPATVANHPVGDCSEPMVESNAAGATATSVEPEISAASVGCAASVIPNLNSAESDQVEFGTVQEVLEQLENVPRKARKQLRREQRMRQELFGRTTGSPLATLGLNG